MRTPIPSHSGHSWNRNVFLYQTRKHPEGQKDHLRQNSLRLQTSQKRKGTCPDHRGRRQTRLLRKHHHFHGRHHNIHIIINSTLSTEDAAMIMMDIKNYYLGNPLPRFEYMKMLLSRFLEEIVQKYNLNALAVDGWVYIEIRKGMYGLKHAGLLANQLLQTRLAPFGYYLALHTPGLWLHKTRSITFTLVMDDFAVKYVGKHHAEHLRNALLQTYELTTDWTATVYSGMTLKWGVSNVLSKFQHDAPQASTTHPVPVLNYSHSRNPPCAPARTHGRSQAPREPPN
jgi:hypothetical protein